MGLVGSARLENAAVVAGWPGHVVGVLARRELARVSVPEEQRRAIERVIDDLEALVPSATSDDGTPGRKRVGELPPVIELTPRQVADRLGVGMRRVGQLRGHLPHRPVGRSFLYDADGVEAFARSREGA